MKIRSITVTVALLAATPVLADERCSIPDGVVSNLQAKLATVVGMGDANGGLFSPNRMWSAVVDRQGVVRSRFLEPDFRRRMDISQLIEALRAARSS